VYWKDLIKEIKKFDRIEKENCDEQNHFIENDQNWVRLHLKLLAFIDYTHLYSSNEIVAS
jgi:hypothetical protein